jgi:molybdopterin-guanine dinucleotide biosynthesis protein A
MTARAAVTGIVLAGGRSTRFGRDKLAEPLGGRPLVRHAIDAIRPMVTDVIVVLAPGVTGPSRADERVVNDREPFEGPLAGLLVGLEAATEPLAIVVAGDMPGLVPAVLEMLLDALDDDAVEAATLAHEGARRPLPVAVRVGAATAATGDLLEQGQRSLRALLGRLTTATIPEESWRRVDPDGATLRDVDRPEDLPARP